MIFWVPIHHPLGFKRYPLEEVGTSEYSSHIHPYPVLICFKMLSAPCRFSVFSSKLFDLAWLFYVPSFGINLANLKKPWHPKSELTQTSHEWILNQAPLKKFHRIISCWMNRHPTKNEDPKINNAIEILPSCGWKFTLLQEVHKDVQPPKKTRPWRPNAPRMNVFPRHPI